MQFLARLEPDSFAWGNADLCSRAGIASNSGFARADAENSKSAQFDALACRKCLLQTLEDRIHSRLCFGTGQACTLDHMMDDVLFNQRSNLVGPTLFTLLRE